MVKDQHNGFLVYRVIENGILIDDNRANSRAGTYAFDGALASLYTYCSDAIRSAANVLSHLETVVPDQPVSIDEVQTALQTFCDMGLMVGEDGLYLSLALPSNPNL